MFLLSRATLSCSSYGATSTLHPKFDVQLCILVLCIWCPHVLSNVNSNTQNRALLKAVKSVSATSPAYLWWFWWCSCCSLCVSTTSALNRPTGHHVHVLCQMLQINASVTGWIACFEMTTSWGCCVTHQPPQLYHPPGPALSQWQGCHSPSNVGIIITT